MSGNESSALEGIRRAINAEPFRPFAIQLRNGSVYPIQRRDQIALGPGKSATFMVATDDDAFFLLSIQDVETTKVLPVHVVFSKG